MSDFYLGLPLVEERPLTALEKEEWRTARDEDERRLRRFPITVLKFFGGLIAVGALCGFLAALFHVKGTPSSNFSFIATPIVLGLMTNWFALSSRRQARKQFPETIRVYRGPILPEYDLLLRGKLACSKRSLHNRRPGDVVEIALTSPGGLVFQIDGLSPKTALLSTLVEPELVDAAEPSMSRTLNDAEIVEVKAQLKERWYQWAIVTVIAGAIVIPISLFTAVEGAGLVLATPFILSPLYLCGVTVAFCRVLAFHRDVRGRSVQRVRGRVMKGTEERMIEMLPRSRVAWRINGMPAPFRYGKSTSMERVQSGFAEVEPSLDHAVPMSVDVTESQADAQVISGP